MAPPNAASLSVVGAALDVQCIRIGDGASTLSLVPGKGAVINGSRAQEIVDGAAKRAEPEIYSLVICKRAVVNGQRADCLDGAPAGQPRYR